MKVIESLKIKEKAYIESRNGKKYNKVNYCIDLR